MSAIKHAAETSHDEAMGMIREGLRRIATMPYDAERHPDDDDLTLLGGRTGYGITEDEINEILLTLLEYAGEMPCNDTPMPYKLYRGLGDLVEECGLA